MRPPFLLSFTSCDWRCMCCNPSSNYCIHIYRVTIARFLNMVQFSWKGIEGRLLSCISYYCYYLVGFYFDFCFFASGANISGPSLRASRAPIARGVHLQPLNFLFLQQADVRIMLGLLCYIAGNFGFQVGDLCFCFFGVMANIYEHWGNFVGNWRMGAARLGFVSKVIKTKMSLLILHSANSRMTA